MNNLKKEIKLHTLSKFDGESGAGGDGSGQNGQIGAGGGNYKGGGDGGYIPREAITIKLKNKTEKKCMHNTIGKTKGKLIYCKNCHPVKSWEEKLKGALCINGKVCFCQHAIYHEEALKNFISSELNRQQGDLVEKIEKLDHNSESRTLELECQQEGYEYGLEDALRVIEEI